MANANFNRVDAVLTPEALQTVKDHLAAIQQALPF